MTGSRKEIIWRWLGGSLLGTLIIAVSSPLFLRSYLPQTYDTVRHVFVPPSDAHYRWRSEGYAATFIGPLGMPGRRDIPAVDPDELRLAIWGDSQAEGVCVNDHSKLHSQIEMAGNDVGKKLTAFPLARSGDNASDWLRQFPGVQEKLGVDVHVLLVVELADLIAAIESRDDSSEASIKLSVADALPAFMIESARRMMTGGDGQLRRLRFSVGPFSAESTPSAKVPQVISWDAVIKRLDDATDVPMMLVYAPLVPNITDGQVQTDDGDADAFEAMQAAAVKANVRIVDVRDSMRHIAANGNWPHGFHNGHIGSGHLNEAGYQIIARHIAVALQHMNPQE